MRNRKLGEKDRLTCAIRILIDRNILQLKTNSACNPILKNISMEKLKSFLGNDWDNYKNNPELLELWTDLLFKNHLMEQGNLPNNFTATTWCNLCGYVYVPPELTNGGRVLGCPWCWNVVKKLPIPKPVNAH